MNLNTKTLTTSGSLVSTDDVVILNDTTGGTDTVTLPAGTNGLTVMITLVSTNTGVWSLQPSGTDVLDSSIIYAHGTFTFSNGTWYACI